MTSDTSATIAFKKIEFPSTLLYDISEKMRKSDQVGHGNDACYYIPKFSK
jgi:hypothetical protein